MDDSRAIPEFMRCRPDFSVCNAMMALLKFIVEASNYSIILLALLQVQLHIVDNNYLVISLKKDLLNPK
jgi:hypothetical protein